MQKLSKSEFMHKVINDRYKKKLNSQDQGYAHTVENIEKVNKYKSKKRR